MDAPSSFAAALLNWYDRHRSELPWRQTRDPYSVWVSEIMLQQTQIAVVIPYYERWMARFPDVAALAAAGLDDVLKQWEGLGYYRRARNLHAAARQVMDVLDGELPQSAAAWMQLKGVGKYTAGAIASICFNEPVPVLDGNVIRVITRLDDIAEDVSKSAVKRRLWKLAASRVPVERPGDYNQALMELGQKVCRSQSPACQLCPVRTRCKAAALGTQLERPVKPARRRIPHYDVVAGIIRREPEQPGAGGQFLITQRPLDGLLGGLWEFPGGKVETGETHAQALQRELMEELGITVNVGAFQTQIEHAYTHFRITLHAYHASTSAGMIRHLGVADHAWVQLEDLDAYAFAVTDRKIIASLTGK